jgi:hydrogenase maturation protease
MPSEPATLVIGYGNDLRGDDAAGRVVAARVQVWALPRVRVLDLHQLTPDVAGALAGVSRAVFVDAHPAALCPDIRIRPVHAAASPASLGHAGSPAAVLAWAVVAGHAAPRAWWITIPAETFDLGAPLSPRTARGIEDALTAIHGLLISNLEPGTGNPAPSAEAHPCPTR